MKKVAIFSVLFSLVAALFFAACEKETTPSAADAAGYANTENPFDYIGAKHNECLDILEKYGTSKGLNIASDAQKLTDNGQGTIEYKPFLDEFALVLSSKDPIKHLTTKQLKEGRISQAMYQAMDDLNDIIKSYGFSSQLSTNVINYEKTFPSLPLTTEERNLLYAAASVARYSNAYWSAEIAGQPVDRFWKEAATIGADVVVTVLGGPGLGAVASYTVWNLLSSAAPGGGQYGFPWGGGLTGPPCDPSYACPCTIEPGGGDLGPFYMSGIGVAIDPSTVFMAMDGSQLDPGFAERFNTGVYEQEMDRTIPEQVVRELYDASGLELPSGPTVFLAGPKEVLVMDNAWYVTFPVTYEDGTAVNWFVMINHGE